MFSSGSYSGMRPTATSMYKAVNASAAVEGASPHKLVSMLYGAVGNEIAAARGALARGDIGEKGRAIGHAVRIVEEGLLAPLDMERGGPIATNLRDLYQYMVYRLTIGNVKSDDGALADCARLLATLREGWEAIAPQVDGHAQAAA